MNSRTLKRGFTLVEILVVIAIILILAAVVWLAIAPSIKAKALETRIRSDLRQIATAVNIYMAENDDKLPITFRGFPPQTPRSIEGYEKRGPLAPAFEGPRMYMLIHTQKDENDARRLGCTHLWDSSKNGIVNAPFRQRLTGGKMHINNYNPKDWSVMNIGSLPEVLELRACLDGHIVWQHEIEEWQNELAMRRAFMR